MKKNENNSEVNIKSFDENNNEEKNNKLFLSHDKINIHNFAKSKSTIKLKICDTINTKIKNLKHKIKTENNNINIKNNKNIRYKENKNTFSS